MSLDISIHQVKNYLDHGLEFSCFNLRMDRRLKKHANRRARLHQLIQERADGNQAKFGSLYGYARARIGQFLSPSYNGGLSMGEGVVDKLEAACDLPDGWFDWPADGTKDWPFKAVDEEKVRKLSTEALDQLESTMLDWASSTGLEIKKNV